MTNSKFRLFLLFKIPIAFLAGLKLNILNEENAQIIVKFGFFNQNPFKSMFWAVQGMAAELSTGILCLDVIGKSQKQVSMLVIEQSGKFTKKAIGKIIFTCNQGKEIQAIIQQAIDTNQPKVLELHSTGIDEKGDIVAKFSFLWSFKVKN